MAYRLLVLLLILPSSFAHAGIFEEHSGVRSAGMGGAHRALGTSNEAIYLNPATIASFARFGIDLELAYQKPEKLRRMRVSAVDSKTSAVAAGIGHEIIQDAPGYASLKRTSLSVAHRLGQYASFGTTGHYIEGTRTVDGEEVDFTTLNTDIGFSLNLSDLIQLGVSWHNLADSDEQTLSPESVGLGFAIGSQILVGVFDVRLEEDGQGESQASYHAGAEIFLGGAIPIRAGYSRDALDPETNQKHHRITGGIGYVTKTGALDMAIDKSLTDSKNWTLVTAIKLFM